MRAWTARTARTAWPGGSPARAAPGRGRASELGCWGFEELMLRSKVNNGG